MEATLKTQIRAIQARMDAVAPDASPEDIVMLAKAVEAVGGRATVFDVLEAGENAAASALADIGEAGRAALDEVHAAGGVTDAVLDSIAAISGRIDAAHFALTKSANPLPDKVKGVYVLTADNSAYASVSLPAYAGDAAELRNYTLLNDSAFVLSVQDSAGGHVGAVQPHGSCFAFVTEDAEGGWRWKVTRGDEGGANVLFDQSLIVLDGLPAQYMQILPMPDGFVVCWTYSGTFKLACLQWQEGKLVQSEIFSRQYTGIASFSVARAASYSLVLAWEHSRCNVSAALISLSSGATVSVSFGEEVAVYTSSSSALTDCVVSMFSDTKGFIAGRHQSSSATYNHYVYSVTISGTTLTVGSYISMSSDNYQSQLSIQSMDTRPDGMGVLMDSPYASAYASVYLASFKANGTSSPMVTERIAYGFADMGSNRYSQMVRFLKNDLILCCWWNNNKLHWRLVSMNTAGNITMGSFGMVDIPDVYFSASRNVYMQLLVLSEDRVALVVTGNANAFPRVLFGAVNAAGTDISWGSLVDLPFSVKNNTPTICACHDSTRNALLVGENISGTSPFALAAKL